VDDGELDENDGFSVASVVLVGEKEVEEDGGVFVGIAVG